MIFHYLRTVYTPAEETIHSKAYKICIKAGKWRLWILIVAAIWFLIAVGINPRMNENPVRALTAWIIGIAFVAIVVLSMLINAASRRLDRLRKEVLDDLTASWLELDGNRNRTDWTGEALLKEARVTFKQPELALVYTYLDSMRNPRAMYFKLFDERTVILETMLYEQDAHPRLTRWYGNDDIKSEKPPTQEMCECLDKIQAHLLKRHQETAA